MNLECEICDSFAGGDLHEKYRLFEDGSIDKCTVCTSCGEDDPDGMFYFTLTFSEAAALRSLMRLGVGEGNYEPSEDEAV